ncbi:HlyD family secretion protein [Ferruginibacter sp.]|nr:HlyD family efflux transporter periplasmic adaptor subunit [Ferruginibacter sp.]
MATDNPIILPADFDDAKENAFVMRNTFLEHGNEIEEIISNKLPSIVRWGTVYFLILLLLLAAICWFIQYPDIVNTKAKLTSINAPKEVITKAAGKLIKLIAKEGQTVQQNELLGYMESRANADEVLTLSTITDTLQNLLQNNQVEKIPRYLVQPFKNLGEVQPAYQSFMQGFILFNQYLSSGYYLKKKVMLKKDMSYLQKLYVNLLQQKSIQQEDVALADTTFKMNKRLQEQKVIASLEYRNERSKFLNKAMSIPQINSNIISNQSSQQEKQKEILQLENDIAQQKEIFIQALHTLKAQLEDWKSKYLLVAPVDGKIAFATFLQKNQHLQNNQIICFVNPENAQYYAEVYIPQTNFGKVKTGQQVLLKFPAYPFQEYGSIKGTIDFISHITTDSGYLAKVILPNGLNTSYKKSIQFTEGLTAQGEIVTADMRLLQRFYYNIVKQVSR